MSIASFCEEHLKLTKRQGAIVQISMCTIILISAFVFSDFFVCASIFIAILLPLYLFNVWLIRNIFDGCRQLNLS